MVVGILDGEKFTVSGGGGLGLQLGAGDLGWLGIVEAIHNLNRRIKFLSVFWNCTYNS